MSNQIVGLGVYLHNKILTKILFVCIFFLMAVEMIYALLNPTQPDADHMGIGRIEFD